MVSQGAYEHQSRNSVDGISNFASLSVSAQPAGATAVITQRTAANGPSKQPNGVRPMGGSSKNPFAAMPREMRNNQLRNNLAAVAEQFKAMGNGQTGASGISSPTGSSRTSAEFGNFPQQQTAPFMGPNSCQVSAPQAALAAQQTTAGRSPNSGSPTNGLLDPSSVANSCSPSLLHGLSAVPAAYPPPPPHNQQQFLQQYPNRQQQPRTAGSRSTSLDLQFNRNSSDSAAAFEARRSVDLSPYMVHQMQLQQLQQQQSGYGMHHSPQMPAMHPTSDPFPQLLMQSCNGTFSQQQQLLLSQPMLLGQTGGYSSSDPAMFTPNMQQQQPQVVMSASASLPPVTVALPVAQHHAAAHTERQLQKLLFNHQMEQVMQQRLMQLSAEY